MAEPIRIHVFPDRPEFLLLYVPHGDFRLPRLLSPFVQGDVKAACSLGGVDVRVSETVPGRWTKAMLKARSDARIERRQQAKLREATEATILRGSSSETERDRAGLLLEKQQVDGDLARLKAELREAKNRVWSEGRYMPRKVYQRKEALCEQLKLKSQAIQVRLSELRTAEKARNVIEARKDQTRYIKALRGVLHEILDPEEFQEVEEEVEFRLGETDAGA